MFKLIMADIKVLGNRLWTIPLVVFLVSVGIALIGIFFVVLPISGETELRIIGSDRGNLEVVLFFILELVTLSFLVIELLREDQKNGSDRLMMTIPVSKADYVLAKYFTVILLSLISIPGSWLTNIIMMFIQGTEFTFIESVSFFPGLLKATVPIILFIYFVLPIYYFTKSIKATIMSGLLIFWATTVGLMTVLYEYFYSHYYNDDITNFIYSFLIVIGTAVIVHFIIKFFYRSFPDEWIKTGWFSVILFLSIISFDMLMNNLDSIWVYFRLMNKLDTTTGPDKEIYLNILSNFRYYVSVFSLSLILCVTALIILRRKSSDLFFQNCVFYVFSISIAIIFVNRIFFLLGPLFDSLGYNLYPSNLDVLIIAMFIVVIISVRASIYLLKNNRTLK